MKLSLRSMTHARTVTALSLTTILSLAEAKAESPMVYLWGFQRACERLPDLDRGIEKKLYSERRDVALLQTARGQPLPSCPVGQEDRCMQSLRALCPTMQGRVLGGQIARGQDTMRARLWLYDLATGQVAYQDDYCQACGEIPALTVQARQLIDHPVFGARPGPKPAYCNPGTSAASAQQPLGPIFLTVFGDGKHKGALSTALKHQLGLRGRQVLPMPFEPRNYGPEELERIVSGQPDAQVLGAESRKDGSVFLFVYDAKTKRLADRILECEDCSKDKDALTLRVQPEVASLLERCYSLQCGNPSARHPGIEPPVEACEPFPASACSGLETLGTAPFTVAKVSRGVDPATAKTLKGLTWGAFAVSAATAITLFAVSSTPAGTQTGPSGIPIYNGLDRPAWATLGMAGVLLGVAIPATVILNRAANPVHHGLVQTGQSPIQCPN